MISPEELRRKLSSSQFFKDIQSKTKTNILACNRGILYGVSDEQETVVSLSLNNRQTLSKICDIPLHGITNLTFSEDGSLLMWSSTGVSAINYPVRPETQPVTIQERLGSEYILQAKWDGQRIIVLKSNNEVLLYDDPKQRPVIMPNISVRDKLTDIVALGEQEILTVSSNGFVRINDDIVCNVELAGDIQLQQIQEDIFVAATAEMAVHFLFIEEEAIVVEKVELAVSDSFDDQIHVLSDASCNSRYFIFSQTGLNCISLNWVDEMRESGRIPDSSPSTIEVLVTTANERGARITGSALCLDRAPNSVSFDGPICCSSMSNGSAFFIPLLSLPSALCVAKSDPSRKPPKIPESIIDKLKLVLSKPPTYLLPANGASLSTQEQIKIVAKVIAEMKTEHLARGKAAREAINQHVAVLKKDYTEQKNSLSNIEALKKDVRSSAERIGERVETIIDKQNELEERLMNVMVQLGQGRMTEAEKEAAKELRESERQLQVHKQTISRLKKMSNKLPLPEEETEKSSAASGSLLMRPLTDTSEKINDLVREIKSLKLEFSNMGKNNGKRKMNYKQVYGGTDPQDIKRCKYSGNSVDPKDTTHGFLMSYRRKCLKQCHREAFSIAKYFTNQVYPQLVDQNGDRVVECTPVDDNETEEEHVDIEKQLLAESQANSEDKNDRFMDIRHEKLESKSILNTMWETILAEKVPDNFRVPSHLERLLPIQRVCTATKEIMTETIKDVLEKEMPADVKDYHVMTRARFHSSLDSQAVKTMVIGVVKEARPDMTIDWKKTDDVIFVEVLKKNCYIGIFKDWLPRQKYNWQEYHKRKTGAISTIPKVAENNEEKQEKESKEHAEVGSIQKEGEKVESVSESQETEKQEENIEDKNAIPKEDPEKPNSEAQK
ncbi:Oidioi.mRNA.OKI2018_I69.XSR.g16463.t1.cds [Oikopleura dioica]|uniref:Oidioi.mRNA.OKI2018_I69.XSR.g16463.t1.cds n=1 Tax=Oikopleura dioica TaxID=34765 RepID=A0ABN7SNG9_OIKDI|nr:Oidioi.mRNA.OKI2018_I69.XSR.g16463.t1.cds [Oikopleura dioica]